MKLTSAPISIALVVINYSTKLGITHNFNLNVMLIVNLLLGNDLAMSIVC